MGSVEKQCCPQQECEEPKKKIDHTKIQKLDPTDVAAEEHRNTTFLKTFPNENVEKGLWLNDKIECKLVEGKGYGLFAKEPISAGMHVY